MKRERDEHAPRWFDPCDDYEEDGLHTRDEIDAMRADDLISETKTIEQRQRSWHQVNLWNSTLYSNRVLPAFHWGDTTHTSEEMLPANQTTENLVLSIGDSMVSKAASSPLKPTPVPRGASFNTKRKIRKLDRWLFGTWQQLKCEALARRAFEDAYVSGIGIIRLDHDGDSLVAESVFFDNLIIDTREAANRAPIKTWRLRAAYSIEAIEARYDVELDEDKGRDYADYRQVSDGYCIVVEAWRLPQGDEPGRHVVACAGRILSDEPWDRPAPPLIIMKWRQHPSGFHSPSGVEQVVPYQINLNNLNSKIKQAQAITLTPRLLVPTGARLNVNQLDNTPGEIWYYTGVKPEPFIWPAVPAELYAERDREIERCFEFFGISQMSAQSQLPASVRLDSSAAVREFRTMEDTRFLDLWTRYEDFRLELAKGLVDVMIHDPDSDHLTTWYSGGKYKAETIAWKDMEELQADNFSWSMEAVALASMSPAARKDTLTEWLGQGLIGPDEARSMSGQPDLESIDDLESASIRAVNRMIDEIEDGKDNVVPDATTNLVYGIPKFLFALNDLDEYEDVPLEVYDNMREWVRVAQALKNPVVTDPTMQAPGPGPAQGIGGMELPNNSQGLPGQPFLGNATNPAAPPVNNGMPVGPMTGGPPPIV